MTDPHHHHHHHRLNTNTNTSRSASASVTTNTRQEDLKKKKQINPMQPRNHQIFDPWNSASTGHQRAENPYSRTTEWRDTRREKLASQFRAGDTPPAAALASEARDARGGVGGGGGGGGGQWQWVSKHEATRLELGVSDIRQYMAGISKTGGHNAAEERDKIELLKKGESRESSTPSFFSLAERERAFFKAGDSSSPSSRSLVVDKTPRSSTGLHHRKESTKSQTKRKGIFTSLTFYINGSTYPTVSDHRLKRLIAEEGGNLSLYLARKSVTHVILGSSTTTTTTTKRCDYINADTIKEANKKPTGGGLLAAGKLQKESLAKTSGFGRGVKYVNVEWVIESIKAGKKLSESRFAPSLSSVGRTTCSSSSSLESSSSESILVDDQKSLDGRSPLPLPPAAGGGGGGSDTRKEYRVGVPAGQRSVYDMFKKAT